MRTPSILIGTCLLSLTASLQAQEFERDDFEITSVVANGDGCPQGSVKTNMAPDRGSFTLMFDQYIAETGPGLSPSAARKSCQLMINLKVPIGWRYAIAGFDYIGYAKLDEGIEAQHTASYYFQGLKDETEYVNTRKGPENAPFHYQQEVKVSDKTWSPCNTSRGLSIQTSVRVRNVDLARYPNAGGIMGNDQITGTFNQKWKLSWAKCP